MKEMFGGLPKWAQGVIAVAVVGGVGFLGYKAYKKIQESKSLKDSDQTAKDANDEYKKLLRSGGSGATLTHPEIVYQTASNSIVNLLNGCELPSSEQEVVKTIKETVKKPIDWYFLVKKFGSQMIDDCGWGTGESPYALPELLKDQLGQGDYLGFPTGGNYEDTKKYLKSIGITI